MTIRLIAYCRVSTEEQAQEGLSLGVQEARLLSYPQVYPEAEIVGLEADSASGKSLARPGLTRALEAVTEGRADGIVVAALDRLTRSLRDLLFLIEGPLRGKALVSMQERIDTTTAMGRFALTIIVAVAQLERERIGERVREVMRATGHLGGRAPYGYRWEAGGLVPEPEEQRWVEAMLEHRRLGLKASQITRMLNDQGVPSRRGGHWHETQVRRLLRRERKRA